MTNDYSDIIHLPRHISKTHPPMSADSRAAQFAPYAALVGHKDLIQANEIQAESLTDIDHDIRIVSDDDY